MRSAPHILLILLALSVAAYGWRKMESAKAEQSISRSDLQALQASIEQAMQEQSAREEEIRILSQQMGAIMRQPDSEREVRSWLTRATDLRQHFLNHPEQGIPELDFLTDLEWLKLARDADLASESGTQRALAASRKLAAEKFVRIVGPAVRTFKASHERWPESPLEFLPLLEEPVNPDAFSRYRMVLSGAIQPTAYGLYVLVEKEPVNADYDTTMHAVNDRGIVNVSSWAESPLNLAIKDAQVAYLQTHDWQTPRGDAQYYVPYIDSPDIQDIVRARFAFQDSMRGNPRPDAGTIRDGAVLFPYLESESARIMAKVIWPGSGE